jgi:integrase
VASITKRIAATGDARYDVRTRIDGRVVTRTFKRRKDAEAWAAVTEADKLRGVVVDPAAGRITIERLAEMWLASNPGKRESTIGRDLSALHVHILPAIGQRRIQNIRPPDVQQLVGTWADRLAPRTVGRTFATLRALLNYAVAAELISRSPCRNVKLPRGHVRKPQVVSEDELAVLAGAIDSRYSLMVWFGALTGLRWGEIAGLRVGHLDLLERSVTVDEIVTRDRTGKTIVGPPKSEAGRRTIALPGVLVEPLAAHLATQGVSAAHPRAYIFPGPEGQPLGYANFRTRIWVPATEAAGIPGFGFHDLRRMSATLLIRGGVDVKTVQTRLGHSDPRLTLGLYAQAVGAADRAAADVLGHFGAAVAEPARDRRAMVARKRRGRPA